jgi:hypothetical protein
MLPIFIQHSIGIPSQSNKEEEIKGIQVGKEETKLSLFAYDRILNLKDPENSTKKLPGYHKHLQQSSTTLNPLTKISSLTMYQ